MERPAARAAVFLDRDGTLWEEDGYTRDPALYRVFPWAGEAIRRINEAGMAAVLVTNQSGVARGYFDREAVERVHAQLREDLARSGARLDGVYYCPHHPDEDCVCRKPRPGLIRQAGRDLNLRLDDSFMIGDRYTDIRAGAGAGTRTILVLTGYGDRERAAHLDGGIQPDHVARTLEEAVRWILATPGRP